MTFANQLIHQNCLIKADTSFEHYFFVIRETFRNYLAIKSQRKRSARYQRHLTGREFRVTNEYNTTRACSNCDQLTGPRGLRQLVVRNWICSACNTEHQRDTNSAKNQPSAPVSKKYVSSFEPRYRLLLAGTIQNFISPSGQVNNTTVSQTTQVYVRYQSNATALE